MELYDENINEKKSKIPMIIGICIAILIVLTILIIFGIIYLKNSITTIEIDGISNNKIEEILYIESTEQGSQLYIPILKIAPILGYEGFNGDYLNKSEDKTKCHIISENEIAMFTKDSDKLIKVAQNSEIEYVTLDKAVFEKNGELYTTIDGIENAFNVMFSVDEGFKNISIFSMDYLINYWTTHLKIEEYSEEFTDKKAIFENMIIIKNDNKYGVIDIEKGNAILESKYEQIRYLPVTTDFVVKSNGKYGIVTKDATVKVKTLYDNIQTMDNQNGLYLVEQNGSFGVININGDTIIEPEYKQIGIDIDRYTQNGVENSFVLLNEIIPIKNNEGLWGFFNIKGEKITDFKYTGVGCSTLPVSNSYAALVVPSHRIIVVEKDKYYTLITSSGEQLVPDNTLNSVYIKSNLTTEKNEFFMTYHNNEKVINIEEWLESTER
ncbi:MAG: WG repeat-containing protein [Clostridia bacterium]|nr:WG repeat-containing protein [Clostridia bacterium]